MTIKINETNFDYEVNEADEPVLIAFYASWCRSRRLNALIEDMCAELNGNTKVVKVDVEESPNLASRFNVQQVPSFVVLDHGKVRKTQEVQLTA